MNDKTDQKTEQTPIEQPDAKPAEAPIELTVSDLSNLKQIIDVASSRGAFKPNEMTVVGTVYTKLETFLNAVAAQQKPAAGEETNA
tara:strand:+ start:1614 stop:1871 length:258 start_codon:yes stop_codon:yes gene_type:complete